MFATVATQSTLTSEASDNMQVLAKKRKTGTEREREREIDMETETDSQPASQERQTEAGRQEEGRGRGRGYRGRVDAAHYAAYASPKHDSRTRTGEATSRNSP